MWIKARLWFILDILRAASLVRPRKVTRVHKDFSNVNYLSHFQRVVVDSDMVAALYVLIWCLHRYGLNSGVHTHILLLKHQPGYECTHEMELFDTHFVYFSQVLPVWLENVSYK